MLIRLVVAALVIGWFGSYLRPEGGDKEFQAVIDATKQVRSMRPGSSSRAAVYFDDQPRSHSKRR